MMRRFCSQFRLVRLSSRLDSVEPLLESLCIGGVGLRESQFCRKRLAASVVLMMG